MTANHPTTLVDWLDDLTVRFLLNLPPSELSSVPRLCFQVEEAQWYYEDFVRPAVAASGAQPLPSLSLRQFCLSLFAHCPLLSGFTDEQHIAAYEEFLAYKVRVPVRGAIMLDERMEKVLLVRGWKKGASWSFPRGKINKDEKDLDCAIREVYEETGYDARRAGVVPENEDDAKFIDITMREQHMRLFVFRGIPENTHFEPKTRKEIGAIQWYSIKDLPGFKKGKAENDGMNANKFYMVAPFLGHLKKWIGQQKKLDKTRAASAVQMTTEDEADYEEERIADVSIPGHTTSEDLKRLLSIGQTPQAAALSTPSEHPQGHANNLLAMLQGTAKPPNDPQLPHTPFEQIKAFPPQPETPQPDHLRHPSLSQQFQQPPPPAFPLSPQSLFRQESQQQSSRPNPNIFGPGPSGFPSGQSQGFPNMSPQQQGPPHHFEQRQSMPPEPLPWPVGQPGVPSFNGGAQSRGPSQQMPFQAGHPQAPAMWPASPPPIAFMAQGPQGAIGSRPNVPSASQLPAPRLNAQSMKLLDAFKTSARQPTASSAPTVALTQPRAASTHQTALLDLFKKPAVSTPPDVNATDPEMPASPTGTDVTEKPIKPLERRPTLNEITRTLPKKMKVKSPPAAPAPNTQQSGPVADMERPKPKSRELFDPAAPVKPSPTNKALSEQQHQSSMLHSPKTRQSPRSPRGGRASPPPGSSRNGPPTGQSSTNQPMAAPVTILARPGSAKGPKSPVPPPSPLRNSNHNATFQPQVLKRPKAADTAEAEHQPADKKDQLLALFGKTSSTPTPSAAQATATPTPTTPEIQSNNTDASKQKIALLGLFNTSQSPSPAATSVLTPPPAPRIAPERSPTGRSVATPPTVLQHPVAPAPRSASQQSSLLLDLFHNQNNKQIPSRSASGQQSPGTPISPFTLGTPVVSSLDGMARSRVGSVVNPLNADGSVRSPTAETPQQKQFLKGLLNEVVRKEGI